MNCRHILHTIQKQSTRRTKSVSVSMPMPMPMSMSMPISTTASLQAMKPGTPIAGLDFLKNAEQAVSKERSEYPAWINNLEKGDTTLAKLRKMDLWSADEKDQRRYLKLTRRLKIKSNNVDAGNR